MQGGLLAVLGASLALHARSQCGTTVYDTGGAGGNYGNNQNLTWTYCAPPGQVITITFTAFGTEAGFDELSIHDGPTNAAPMMGIYSGTVLPPSFTGSTPGGCLTLWFTSDFSITGAGWVANITCSAPPPPPAGDCVYQLSMFDSFGDGWDGSTVGISINGGPFTPYTITGGSGSALIGLNIGDVLVVQYTAAGIYQNEIGYTLSFYGGAGIFNSGTPPATGIVFTQTIDCNPPPSPPEDCLGAITICSGQSFNNNTQNTGFTADLTATNYGCLLAAEQQGTWYTWSPATSGQVGFTIDPAGPDDYDWAIWGPYPTGSTTGTMCPPSGPPIRCSFASGLSTLLATGNYNTGMGNAVYSPPQWANPTPGYSETAAGDGWVSGINVTAGQVYLMYISNFDQTGLAFSLSWQLAGGASLDCTVLPVELAGFIATDMGGHVRIEWTTATESNTSHFDVERSTEGGSFDKIATVPAAGNSQTATAYEAIDGAPVLGVNYYRLVQVDLDGRVVRSDVVSVRFNGTLAGTVIGPNPATSGLTISIEAREAGAHHLRISDMAGRPVMTWTQDAREGRNTWAIDLTTMEAGSYTLEILGPTGQPLGGTRFVKH